MTQGTRTEAEKRQEAADIIAAQIANGGQRDAFVALGHTVLFTASIAFLADIRPPTEVEAIGILFAAWVSSVVGLFALTWSFHEANSAAGKRLQEINNDALDDRTPFLDVCNAAALWTFPVSMAGIATFAAINLWSML